MVCTLHPGAHAGSKIICGNFACIDLHSCDFSFTTYTKYA